MRQIRAQLVFAMPALFEVQVGVMAWPLSSFVTPEIWQAHMVREWHALAGCTPRDWTLDQLAFLQDDKIGRRP